MWLYGGRIIFRQYGGARSCQGNAFDKFVIEDNVWLGANQVVTSGIIIGTGYVRSACSIFTHELPSMSVCVGNPARPIRSSLSQAMGR